MNETAKKRTIPCYRTHHCGRYTSFWLAIALFDFGHFCICRRLTLFAANSSIHTTTFSDISQFDPFINSFFAFCSELLSHQSLVGRLLLDCTAVRMIKGNSSIFYKICCASTTISPVLFYSFAAIVAIATFISLVCNLLLLLFVASNI